MTMVERMARSMCEADCVTCPQRMDTEWNNESAFYLSFARAALKAMREPTEAMLAAASTNASHQLVAQAFWEAMIAAALSESPGAQ